MRTRRIRKHSEHYGLHRFLDWLITILICLAIVCFFLFVGMKPLVIKTDDVTLFAQGDIVFADRVSKYLVDYGRGDVVIFREKTEFKDETHIGRLIAFPGEKVNISNGKVYINSAALDESAYAVSFPEGFTAEFTVPQGSFLTLPDNRGALPVSDENYDFNSLLITQKNIIGEIRFRIFPFENIDMFY